ncbi:MAG TPA: hypothetical protein VLL48_09830 [Longimicrobiales bacterium]|nr:hypothetical protein [Longimicrobiales bacterium]
MVGIPALWLPIVVAAVLVFVASSVIHMVLPYHKGDWKKVPQEDAFMEAARKLEIPAGDYAVPYAGSSEALKSEEFKEKARKGPVAFMTVLPPGDPFAMGAQLGQWFVYLLVVGVFAAYVTGRALGPGAEYAAVFRFAGVTAFAGYGLAHLQRSIWYAQAWSTTLKNVFDGLVYGLLTAGAFGWLWPDA